MFWKFFAGSPAPSFDSWTTAIMGSMLKKPNEWKINSYGKFEYDTEDDDFYLEVCPESGIIWTSNKLVAQDNYNRRQNIAICGQCLDLKLSPPILLKKENDELPKN